MYFAPFKTTNMTTSLNSITAFLKRSWLLWILLFLASLAIVVIGPSSISKPIFKISSVILSLFLIGWLLLKMYTLSQKDKKLNFGITFRLFGIGGFFLSVVLLFQLFETVSIRTVLWKGEYSVYKTNFLLFLTIGFASLVVLFFSEVLLYLNRKENKSQTKA